MLRLKSYDRVAERLKHVALELKNLVVAETWDSLQGQDVGDFTVYSGVLGTALLLHKSYQVTKSRDASVSVLRLLRLVTVLLLVPEDFVGKVLPFYCISHFATLVLVDGFCFAVSFICGRAGVCALGAVVASLLNDIELMDSYLDKFVQIEPPEDLCDGLLHGRAGYLWACVFMDAHFCRETISRKILVSVEYFLSCLVSLFTKATNGQAPVVDKIFSNGRKLGRKGRSPLIFKWKNKTYWGAAHGSAGIMYVLMHFNLQKDQRKEVKETLLYLIENQFPSGNYPSCEDDSDALVHWCHGAPGIAVTLAKAAETFGDKVFEKAAMDAMKVVWQRGLVKNVGMCHGISGNTYVFCALQRLTGCPRIRFMAKSFTCFLLDRGQKLVSEGKVRGGDHPYSLFEGLGGLAYLFLDMMEPSNARFPAFEAI
ncbi:OLC1v1024010C1 [Oldenlandia corymbosa var. corymbosa]|uniref:OLC1v1024010C1 n=1 Tax=Oldenlandia corymbosa var. corymbosa TaxID=529605 RepID=A0AAV1C2Y6_OLDCO|nr:OLC1v1024010C1 [Oldenlandia corymbosa var. corymbosa]